MQLNFLYFIHLPQNVLFDNVCELSVIEYVESDLEHKSAYVYICCI